MTVSRQYNGRDLTEHFELAIDSFCHGQVIPFLGAGVNLCGSHHSSGSVNATDWTQARRLPSGTELSLYLAKKFHYDDPATAGDLMRVTQYKSVIDSIGPVYQELQNVFARDYRPTVVHTFLAALPSILRRKGYSIGVPLIVTTNYDDVLERSFLTAREPFDLVCYFLKRDGQFGRFWHLPDAHKHIARYLKTTDAAQLTPLPWKVIAEPNTYNLPIGQRTIIFKVHGAVDRMDRDKSSFVIREDDYIEYLARMDLSNPIPKALQAQMKFSRFLFLGYGLRDWNLRVVLARIWGEQVQRFGSWAVQSAAKPIDHRSWSEWKVDILEHRLEDYIRGLKEAFDELRRAAPDGIV